MSVDDMLATLRSSRQSMSEQLEVLKEVIAKSNNVLLEIERSEEKKDVSGLKAYDCSMDVKNLLERAIENYQHVSEREQHNNEAVQSDHGLDNFVQENYQNFNFLNSNVRKLLVNWENMDNAASETQEQDDAGYGE